MTTGNTPSRGLDAIQAKQPFEPIHVIGLMSGTSGDGVDAAIVRTDGESEYEYLGSLTIPYPQPLREQLLRVAQRDVPIDLILDVERRMTLVHHEACQAVLADLGKETPVLPQLIGFHGHTIRHDPENGITWQIGDPNLLSYTANCSVVSDFRRRDIAGGGEGAPLAPLFHREMLRSVAKPVAVLNIGGVANITWLGPNERILAGDTGPGCGLLDAFVAERTGAPCDADGVLASSGHIKADLVERLLQDEFFQRPLPKSADRFQFRTEGIEKLSTEDGTATLCSLTATAITRSFGLLPAIPKALFVTGGGASNPFLMGLLRDALRQNHDCLVDSIEAAELRADSMEAECFAWLAVRRLRALPTSIPETTGCSKPVCGGLLTA